MRPITTSFLLLLISATPAMADAYLDAMAAEEGAITTESGLVYLEQRAGEGDSPTLASVVRAHYHGTLADGSVFDSSVNRGEPLVIPLNRVIKCWQEGIPMMKVGGKAKLTCPAGIAYGSRATGGIPANSTLSFEVELIDIVR
jgi:FKBP-type peptidyl-prolyl cis-trans isomerase FkpA